VAERAAEVAPGLPLDTALLSGSPARTLADAARDASMLVIGTYAVLSHAHGPVACVPDHR
jgi:hypothetical protein